MWCAAGIGEGGPLGITSSVSSGSPALNRARRASGSYLTPTGFSANAGVRMRAVACSTRWQQRRVLWADTYLLGEVDVLPLGVFDATCSAMAQGPNRLERGLAFHEYVNDNHGADHQVVVVPFCGHSQRCIFTSDTVLPLMFPR